MARTQKTTTECARFGCAHTSQHTNAPRNNKPLASSHPRLRAHPQSIFQLRGEQHRARVAPTHPLPDFNPHQKVFFFSRPLCHLGVQHMPSRYIILLPTTPHRSRVRARERRYNVSSLELSRAGAARRHLLRATRCAQDRFFPLFFCFLWHSIVGRGSSVTFASNPARPAAGSNHQRARRPGGWPNSPHSAR